MRLTYDAGDYMYMHYMLDTCLILIYYYNILYRMFNTDVIYFILTILKKKGLYEFQYVYKKCRSLLGRHNLQDISVISASYFC